MSNKALQPTATSPLCSGTLSLDVDGSPLEDIMTKKTQNNLLDCHSFIGFWHVGKRLGANISYKRVC